MKIRYAYLPGPLLWPNCHGVVSVLRETAPRADFLICRERICSVFSELVDS